ERGLVGATGPFFIVNGLHLWNAALKEWTGTVIGLRIVETSRKWAAGTIAEADVAKLARSGIDRNMAERIAGQAEQYGERINGVLMPNTASWDDLAAAR